MTRAPTRGAMRVPGPIKVAVLDVDRPFERLDCRRGASLGYEGAWIVVVRAGRPLGIVEMPLDHGTSVSGPAVLARARYELPALWPAAGTPAARRSTALPTMTVVVPTTAGRGPQLRRCAHCLTALEYPELEIVIVDNRRTGGAGDDVLAELAALDRVRVVAERRPGISAARNRGLREARGAVVAFTDDDVEVDPGWCRALGTRFAEQPELDAVTGLVLPRELETPAQIWFERSGSGLDRGYEPLTFASQGRRQPGAAAWSPGRFLVTRRAPHGEEREQSLYAAGELGLGSNMAFRTDALRALGGFDLALGAGTPTAGGEDLAMLIGLLFSGRLLGYEPGAVVHHGHRREVAELERQIRGYGAGLTATLAALVWNDPRHLAGLVRVVPAALRSVVSTGDGKRSGQAAGYPRGLVRAERAGMLAGPLAYARSRRAQRRWTP